MPFLSNSLDVLTEGYEIVKSGHEYIVREKSYLIQLLIRDLSLVLIFPLIILVLLIFVLCKREITKKKNVEAPTPKFSGDDKNRLQNNL